MNNGKFLRGMGLGMALGAAIGMSCASKPMVTHRSPVGKAVKAMSDLMSDLSDSIGL